MRSALLETFIALGTGAILQAKEADEYWGRTNVGDTARRAGMEGQA